MQFFPSNSGIVPRLSRDRDDASRGSRTDHSGRELQEEQVEDFYERSVIIYEQLHGKIGIVNKVPIEAQDDLSIAYTPGVARPCEMIAADPMRVRDLTIKYNTVAVVFDGSTVLGLGNIGALAAIPVMEGKALLFKEFANIDAWPICLDTQDTGEIIEMVRRIPPVFGGINLEDFTPLLN